MRFPLALLALLLASPALAQPADVPPPEGAVLAAPSDEAVYDGEDFVPPVQQLVHEAYGVSYATGGVGKEEEEALDSIKSDFSLHILSTRNDGAYISGYKIRIIDKADGTIFEGTGEGAWFLLNLKAGTYTVEETHRDFPPQRQKVTVPAKRYREVRFHWDMPKEKPSEPPVAEERIEPGVIVAPDEDELDVEFVR